MHKRNLIGSILVTASLLYCSACTFSWDDSASKTNDYSKVDVLVYLQEAGLEFYESMTVIEHEGESGTYYTGEMSAELDGVLDDLVAAYNADPTTTSPVTTEQIRYDLTEGLSEATRPEQWDSPFMQFMRWNSTPADLVYTYDMPEYSIYEGQKVTAAPTNYDYVTKRNDRPFYTYSYEYEASK